MPLCTRVLPLRVVLFEVSCRPLLGRRRFSDRYAEGAERLYLRQTVLMLLGRGSTSRRSPRSKSAKTSGTALVFSVCRMAQSSRALAHGRLG